MSKNVKLPLPVLGVDVLSDETALPKGAVRSAKNVDIDRAGKFGPRKGRSVVAAGDNFHSVYYAPQKGWALIAQGSTLYRMDTTTLARTELAQLNSAMPISYTEYNGNLYFTNRNSFGWVPSDGTTARTVGVPTPNAPLLSAHPAGSLLPGKYGVVVSTIDDRGEESGTSEFQTIDLPNGGGIRLSNMTWYGQLASIYITDPNGTELYRLGAFYPSGASFTVTNPAPGSDPGTRHLEPLPPGDFVRWHNGRLFTAKNNVLSFSEAMRPHLYNPAHNVIPFVGRISFIESVSDGMYVGDSRGVWFLSGTDPEKFEQRLVSVCRAAMRSSTMVPPEHFERKQVPSEFPVAVWLSTSGYAVGMSGGTVVELHPDRVKVPSGLTGRTVFLMRDGRKQLITPVNSTSTVGNGTAVDSVIS